MSTHRSRLLVVAVLAPLALVVPSASAAPTELFFSEYVEGSSNNKALEISSPRSRSSTRTSSG